MESDDVKDSLEAVEKLTRQEHEILLMLLTGLNQAEIAKKISLPASNVKGLIRQVYRKLDVRDRHHAILKAKGIGLLDNMEEKPGQENHFEKVIENIPTGLVTFLFTDIEGSTRLWENHPKAMKIAFTRQEKILREEIKNHSGFPYKMVGDAFQVAFSHPLNALLAAIKIQERLFVEKWGESSIRVRMALHTCMTEERGNDYVGPELNRIARVLAAGHGGQILITQPTADLLQNLIPKEIYFLDLGFHQLKDLRRQEHIYQVITKNLPSKFPPLKSAKSFSRFLQPSPTIFLGREKEIVEIKQLFTDQEKNAHLVTLIGPGGVGKTRLAMQVAVELLNVYYDGVYFVDLASIKSRHDIIPAIADAFKLELHNGIQDPNEENYQFQVINYLKGKKMLLILDNFEQLNEHVDILVDFLDNCSNLCLLVTSRERLDIPGEWVYPITGLAYPLDGDLASIKQSAAVKLFISNAQRAGFLEITDDDLFEISRICKIIQGMPLGIELAAAWIKVFSCHEIANQIESNLDFLSSSSRGIPDRHRTLRAVFENSWELLAVDEKRKFCRLSIFEGGFTFSAAMEVCGVSLQLLTTLLDKSLLRRLSTGRFIIHEILKQYAYEKLTEDENDLLETKNHLARYYSKWLSQVWERLKGGDHISILASMRSEAQNLQSSWQWMVESRVYELIRPILSVIILFFEMFGPHQEGIQFLNILSQSLENQENPEFLENIKDIRAMLYAGLHHYNRQNLEKAGNFQMKSLALSEDLPLSNAKAYIYILIVSGPGSLKVEKLIDLCYQCVDLFESVDDTWGKALSYLILGDLYNLQKIDFDIADSAYQTSLRLFTDLSNRWGKALALSGLAHLADNTDKKDLACTLFQQSLDLQKQLGNIDRILGVRTELGRIAQEIGNYQLAKDCYKANLAYAVKTGNLTYQNYYKNLIELIPE